MPAPTATLAPTTSTSGSCKVTSVKVNANSSPPQVRPGETLAFTVTWNTVGGCTTATVSWTTTQPGGSFSGSTVGDHKAATTFNAGSALGSSWKVTATVATTPGKDTGSDWQYVYVTADTTFSAASASGKVGGSATLSATLTSGSTPLASRTITFRALGTTLTGTTNATGTATATLSLATATAGSYAYTASFAGDSQYRASSATAALTVQPPDLPAVALAVTAPATVTAGSPASVTIAAVDVNGKMATSYRGTVHVTSSDAQAVLPADRTFTTADAGIATVSVTFGTAGIASLTATDTATTSITGRASVQVAAGAIATITVTPATETITFGASATFAAAASDRYGNAVTTTFTWSAPTGAGCAGGSCTPTAANTSGYTVTASAGGASGSATLVVNKATSITTVTATGSTYSGSAYSGASATTTGLGGAQIAQPQIAYSSGGASLAGAPTDAGDYVATATFAGNDNYLGSTGSATFSTATATPTVTVASVSATYDGNAHGTTGTVTGVGGADLGPATVTYSTANGTAPVGAGTYTATGTFAGNTNHGGASATATIAIGKAASQTTVTAPDIAYSASAYGAASATTTGANGVVIAHPALAYAQNGAPLPSAPTNAGDYVASATFAGDGNYAGSSGSQRFTIAQATPTVAVAPVSVIYDANAHGVTAHVTGVGGTDLGLASVTYSTADGTAPLNAGTYIATASYAGSANYVATSAQTTIDIAKATSLTTVTAPGSTYNGSPYGAASATTTGVGGVVLARPAVTFSQGGVAIAALISAGDYVATASYAGNDNYYGGSGSLALTIAKADPTVSAAAASCTYNGSPCTGTGSAIGVVGETLTPVSLAYSGGSAPTVAGATTYTASYAGSANYNARTSAPATIAIGKATPTVTATGNVCTYSASPCSGTGSATGGAGETLAVTLTYSTANGAAPVDAGTYTLTVSTAGDANDLSGSASATIAIGQATPTVSVTPVSTTFDGTAHGTTARAIGVGGADLGATAVTYNTPDGLAPTSAGTYLAAGAYAGSANYTSASGQATIDIAKATSTTKVTAAGANYNGSAYSGASATTTGVGGITLATPTVTFSQNGTAPAGAPTDAGDYVATATFAGNDNYFGSTGSASFAIAKAVPTVSAANVSCTYSGSPCTGSGSATGVNGEPLTPVTLAYSGGSAPTGAGSSTYTASYAGSANYGAKTSAPATIAIARATPIVTATGNTCTYGGAACAGSGSATGGAGETLTVTLSYSTTGASAPIHAGTYTLTVATNGDANNNAGSATARLTISRASSATTIAAAGPFTYDGNGHGTTASVTGAGGLSQSVAVTYNGGTSAPVNAGSYATAASFAGDADHDASSVSGALTIGQATPTVTVTAVTTTYDGTAHGTTARAIGVGGADLGAATVTYGTADGGAPTNAGTYVATGTFAGSANYSGASGQAAIDIAKATPTVTAASVSCTYNGSACSGSGTATGVSGEALSPVTLVYSGGSAPVAAGSSTYTASYAGNANYSAKTSTPATITVGKASPSVTATGNTCTYSGTACAGSGGATGGAGETLAVTLRYSTATGVAPVDAGTYTLTVSTAGDANNNAASATAAITVSKAASTVTVVPAGPFTYDGNAHGTTASVAGAGGLSQAVTVTYNGSATAPKDVGTYTVTGTFGGDADHNGSAASTTIVIQPAPGGTIAYTGAPLFVTASNTTYTATVTSSAAVTVTVGDVTTARVSFSTDGGATRIPGCANVLVTLTSTGKGTASCQWTATVPSVPGYKVFAVEAILGGNYATATDTKYVLVAIPTTAEKD